MLVEIDIQGGEPESNGPSAIPFMPDYQKHMDRAPALIEKARECDVPVVFIQEAHEASLRAMEYLQTGARFLWLSHQL